MSSDSKTPDNQSASAMLQHSPSAAAESGAAHIVSAHQLCVTSHVLYSSFSKSLGMHVHIHCSCCSLTLLLGPGTNHRQADAAPLPDRSHERFKQAARGLSVRDSSDDLTAMSVLKTKLRQKLS